MFPFTSCLSILRRHESPSDWKQIDGTMVFQIQTGLQLKRRGAISFERTDRNAIYIRMLGDVKVQGQTGHVVPGTAGTLVEAERDMLAKLAVSEERQRFRSRFMSVSKGRRQRKSHTKLSREGKPLVDEFYNTPTQLTLSRLGDWDFNIFSLECLSGGRSLFHVAYHLFQTYDLIRGFHLDSVGLVQFFTLIEQNYHSTNPYHNSVHAADVTQSMHCYLQEKEIYESTSDLEKMAALVAALTHDLDHPGVNNTFLIVTSNHLATLYHNISVLENHHWRSAVGLLEETGVLAHLSTQQRERFLRLLHSLILATDITRQQEFLLRFCQYIEGGEFLYRSNEEQRHFLMQIALKCADISNPCRPWKISQRWSQRICHEFFLQGDMERALSVAVTPLCDRQENTVANIQYGFIQFVVNPLFKAWDRFLGTDLSAQMISNLSHNHSQWKNIMDSGQEISDVDSDFGVQFEQIQKGEDKDSEVQLLDTTMTTSTIEGVDSVIMDDVDSKEIDDRHADMEDEDGKDEEDDVVENDVNLLYHYQNESEESCRCLSPVSEDSEHSIPSIGSNRRFSLPPVMRKDLSFYLGLRKDASIIPIQQHRRQSLPTTVMFFHSRNSVPSPRSLSMDTLLARPKLCNLSPTLEMNFSNLDSSSFIPLKNQTFMLQGGSLTKFVSNPTSRRASCGPSFSEHCILNTQPNAPSDLFTPSFRYPKTSQKQSLVRLASSWPSLARQNMTNGSPQNYTVPSMSSSQTESNKSSSGSPCDEYCQSHYVSDSSQELNLEDPDNVQQSSSRNISPNNPEHHDASYPHCLSLSDLSSHDGHNLSRPQ